MLQKSDMLNWACTAVLWLSHAEVVLWRLNKMWQTGKLYSSFGGLCMRLQRELSFPMYSSEQFVSSNNIVAYETLRPNCGPHQRTGDEGQVSSWKSISNQTLIPTLNKWTYKSQPVPDWTFRWEAMDISPLLPFKRLLLSEALLFQVCSEPKITDYWQELASGAVRKSSQCTSIQSAMCASCCSKRRG